jgi:MFS family permease
MWRFGFFFHDMAFGLLTVFIPLYVVLFQDTSILGGPLLALGVMVSISIFCGIPASYFWGYLCDKTRHYKVFILLSFGSMALILFLMSLPFAQSLIVFVALYILLQMFHNAHDPPKNVLVTEHYSRRDWERAFGFYEGLTEIGFMIGLGIGAFLFASTIAFSLLATYTFYICAILSLIAFILAAALIADPLMIFERRLVGIERTLDFTCRGIEGSARLLDGKPWNGSLKRDSFKAFALSIVLFALASSLFLTPLPIYLKAAFGGQGQFVYIAYILSSIGSTVGYFLIRAKANFIDIRKNMPRFILFRSISVFALAGVISFAIFPTILTYLILLFFGFAFAMYFIMMLSLSMEIIPHGKSGLFDGMVALGAAVGAFIGPFLANYFTFLPDQLVYVPIFLITAILFLFSYIVLNGSRR